MCPQLYVNYKLQSVAHMPMTALGYKVFNTFIDDVFAFFLVQMPLKHRFMTLRDDVVFLGFLYQWWPTGPTEVAPTSSDLNTKAVVMKRWK